MNTVWILVVFFLAETTTHQKYFTQFDTMQEFYEFVKDPSNSDKVSSNVPAYRIYLTEAAKQTGAVCLDGSVPNIYYRPGFGTGVTKFGIDFAGGGWCAGVGDDDYKLVQSMDNCWQRSHVELGTSNLNKPYANLDEQQNDNPNINPLTYNWNMVYVPYCDGGSFTGDSDATLTYNKDVLYFRGFRILKGVMQYLRDHYQLDAATDVVLSGGSAGGLTVWLHANQILDSFTGANVMAMPDSGFFLQWDGAGGYIDGWKWKFQHENTSATLRQLQPECSSGKSSNFDCVFAQNIAPFVKHKMFALQSRFDSWQIKQELRSTDVAAINDYGNNLTVNFFGQYLNKKPGLHGAFFDSCYHHVGEWNEIEIDGYTQSLAQFEFYYNATMHRRFWFQNETYLCDSCCKNV